MQLLRLSSYGAAISVGSVRGGVMGLFLVTLLALGASIRYSHGNLDQTLPPDNSSPSSQQLQTSRTPVFDDDPEATAKLRAALAAEGLDGLVPESLKVEGMELEALQPEAQSRSVQAENSEPTFPESASMMSKLVAQYNAGSGASQAARPVSSGQGHMSLKARRRSSTSLRETSSRRRHRDELKAAPEEADEAKPTEHKVFQEAAPASDDKGATAKEAEKSNSKHALPHSHQHHRGTAKKQPQVESPTYPTDFAKIIHQSWKRESIPNKYRPWTESWKEHHPEWEYILWTDEMNRQLVEEKYKWFLPTYNNFHDEVAFIMRADSARYLYMHAFGGVYSDLDFRVLKPLDPIFEINAGHPTAYLAAIAEDDWDNNIPNAWVASTPGHPFWLYMLAEVMKEASTFTCQGPCNGNYNVERTTGPMVLRNAAHKWLEMAGPEDGELKILRPGLIYPIDWRNPGDADHPCNSWEEKMGEAACWKKYPDAYTITYWSHSWGRR